MKLNCRNFIKKVNSGEFGGWKGYKANITTALLDAFAKIGWVYDRKYATSEMIAKKVVKTGDGTHFLSHDCAHQTSLWGYGDHDLETEDLTELEKLKQ